MARPSNAGYRGPMIHIRLDEQTHKRLRILVAQESTTIQELVTSMIREKISQLNFSKLKARKPYRESK